MKQYAVSQRSNHALRIKSSSSIVWSLCVASLLQLLSRFGADDVLLLPPATAFLAPSATTRRIPHGNSCHRQTNGLQSQQQPDVSRANNPPPHTGPISFELNFGDDNSKVKVELSSPDDIPTVAKKLSDRFGVNAQDVERVLQQSWDAATSGAPQAAVGEDAAPPAYDGPTPTGPWHAECTIELPSGLTIQLGPSTIGENAGLGVFIRQSPTAAEPVLQTQGSAFCGYGPCLKVTDTLDGLSDYQRQRTFEFILPDSLGSYVWFHGQLQTIWDAMQQSQATGVRSHIIDHAENGELRLTPDSNSPCYMVPPEEKLDPKTEITIQTIGHMCNDLAGGAQTSKEEYDTKSSHANLLVLVPVVQVKEGGIIEPSGMPILTMAKNVFVANTDAPMEVGLRYGPAYWNSDG